jgi:hypothetical protein
MQILIVGIIWYIVGVLSFIYWWTSELDLDFNALLLGFVVGLIGPIALVFGYLVHGKPIKLFSKVLMVRRK